MAESRSVNRVVVALLDGTRVKGFVYGFRAADPSFHLHPSEKADRSYARFVDLADCKAIFFVRTHEGDRDLRDRVRKEEPAAKSKVRIRGQRLKIVFNDGEELLASSEAYNPARRGFFAYPLEVRSNNLRVFVVNRNVRQVLTGPSAHAFGEAPAPQERFARSAVPPVGGPAPDPAAVAAAAVAAERVDEGAVSLQVRAELVLRLVAGESAAELAAETGVPEPVLAHWARIFVLQGRAGLAASARRGSDPRDALIAVLQARILELEAECFRVRRDGGSPGPAS